MRFEGHDARQRFTEWCSDHGYLDVEILVAEPPSERQNVEGRLLTSVVKGYDRDLGLRLEFQLNKEGSKRMFSVTSRHKPIDDRYSLLGIVLDDQLFSAPRINEPIRGNGVIDAEFTEAEVDDLISILSSGALDVPGRWTFQCNQTGSAFGR